jgi:hypothetical protein
LNQVKARADADASSSCGIDHGAASWAPAVAPARDRIETRKLPALGHGESIDTRKETDP